MEVAISEQSVCPIFIENPTSGNLNQIGSGVFVEIQGELFLLTAAHVTDYEQVGRILIPGVQGLIAPHGSFAHLAVAAGGKRLDDKLDIAYYRLNREILNELPSTLKPLQREDVALFDSLTEGDIYSFSGYPYRKTRLRGDRIETEFFSYAGCAVDDQTYQKLGYDPRMHIVIRFERKHAYSRDGFRITPPLPHGVSGGGVFSWRKDAFVGGDPEERRLVGIAHTYHTTQNCLIGTRLNAFVSCIYLNNPALAPQTESRSIVPMIMGMAWYRQDEWERLKREFHDADGYPTTWRAWRQKAERGVDELLARGRIISPVGLSADEMQEFCIARKLANISKTRIRLVNEKLYRLAQETYF
jgi:hypothetical protein